MGNLCHTDDFDHLIIIATIIFVTLGDTLLEKALLVGYTPRPINYVSICKGMRVEIKKLDGLILVSENNFFQME